MRASVLVLTLTACWTATPAAPTVRAPSEPEPAITTAALRSTRGRLTHEQRCAKSLATAFDVSRDELAGSGLAPDVVDEIQDAFVTSCEVTQWTDEVLDCIGAVASVEEWNPCQNQMTQEQKDDSIKRAFEILQKRNAIPTSPPPPP
jgi:hypothetical protein